MKNDTLGTDRRSSTDRASSEKEAESSKVDADRTEAIADIIEFALPLVANLFAPSNSLKVSISENEMAVLSDAEIMSLYEMVGRVQCLKAKVRRTCPDEASTSFLSK